MDWTTQIAIVTGGSRGIGAAISRRLAQLGAAVCINYAAPSRKNYSRTPSRGDRSSVRTDAPTEPPISPPADPRSAP